MRKNEAPIIEADQAATSVVRWNISLHMYTSTDKLPYVDSPTINSDKNVATITNQQYPELLALFADCMVSIRK